MKKFLLLIVFAFASQITFATHGQNARITYKCVAPNTYEITLELYRDCNGVNIGNTQTISYTANCENSSFTVLRTSVEDVTPVCTSQQSSCSGGFGSFGVEKHTYKATRIFPANCTNIQLDYNICCRSNSLITISNPNGERVYTRTTFDSSLSTCNNSPSFANNSVIYGVPNKLHTYSLAATDIDGDKLTYELSNPLGNNGLPLSYTAGYDFMNPLGMGNSNNITIDSDSGLLCFTTSSLTTTVAGITVREFRDNVEIATYLLEYYIQILNSAQNLPYIGTNTTDCNDLDINITQTSASLVENNGHSLTLDAGDSFCFDLDFNYSTMGTGDQTILSTVSNAETVLNNSTYTITNNNTLNVDAELCWSPTNADVGKHYVTFSVITDGECPLRVKRDYIYDFTVNASTLSSENFSNKNISIFPNPTKDVLNIKGIALGSTFTIYSLDGKILLKNAINQSNTINTSALKKGFYLIVIETASKKITKKIIKL